MIDADAHPARVTGQVVHAVRDRLALAADQEVMDPYPLRIALRAPFPSGVLEVSDQFLLLGIDGNHRLSCLLLPANLRVDELELSVTVRVFAALLGLLIALKAIPCLHQEPAHRRVADGMAHGLKLPGQRTQTLAGPA